MLDTNKEKADAPKVQAAPRKPRFQSACVWLVVGAVILTLLGSGLGLAFAVPKFVDSITFQRSLYYKGPPDIRSAVVRPLIGPEQTFDLAVSVWVRTDGAANFGDEEENDNKVVEKPLRRKMFPLAPAVPLYSDIVFRGLTLRDKNVFAAINFTVPTAYFRKPILAKDDLRGSVALIPTSPSSLDHIDIYSTWIPDFIDTFPVRSWPFPLGSSKRNKTIADKVLESFGATVPLLQFHNIRKRCENTEDDDSDYDEDTEVNPYKTDGKSPRIHHPYIVTRSQIRIVDEATVFDRRAYMGKHRTLKYNSCQQRSTLFPTFHECDRSYIHVGHVETAISLNTTDEKGVNDIVYSPYISLSRSAGPKDLLPIPIHRDACSTAEDSLRASGDDQESVDVTWNLAFSGLSFLKFAMLEQTEKLQGQTKFDMESSDHHKVLAHDDIEITDAIWGYKHHESLHLGRRYILSAFKLAFAVLVDVFNAVYWYTRTTTVSISMLGSFLLVGAKVITAFAPKIAEGLVHNESAAAWLTTLIDIAFSLIPVYLMVRALFRFTRTSLPTSTTTSKQWIPRRVPTHAERASQRVEDRMSYWTKCAIILLIFAIYYFFSPHYYSVIPAILPDPQPDDYLHSWLIDGWPYFVFPMDVASSCFQLWMNSQTQTFAGSLKIGNQMVFALRVVNVLEYVPGVVGPYDARPRLVAHQLVELLLASVALWQSVKFPVVTQDQDTLHVE
ncbi:hypothetical protein H0H87_008935 [Tephrocybe sp. NHM501043]|nr:hypothetical protein H0H87_008935 [Tephrocybe sp. NHM501043]